MVESVKRLCKTKSHIVLQTSRQNLLMIFLFVFILCALIEPAYITDSTGANERIKLIFKISKYLASFLCVVIFVLSRARFNSLHVSIILFELSLLFSTIINEASLRTWFSNSVYALVLVFFIQAAWKINQRLLLQALSIVLGSYVHINLLCRLIFPGGMYIHAHGYSNCWFLGYDNVAGIIILMSQTIAMYQIFFNRGRLMLWEKSTIFCGLLFILMQTMATAILTEVVFFTYLLLNKFGTLKKTIVNEKVLVVLMFVIFILIHLFSIQENWLISEVFHLLGKNTTFSSRTRIWTIAWNDIMQRGLIFGRGMNESAWYVNHTGLRSAAHLHCYYLQVLYEGGIVALVFLCNLVFKTVKRFDWKHNSFARAIFLACIFAIMLTWQVEAYQHLIRYSFVIFALTYNISITESSRESLKVAHM